ncbi:MAG: MurR/RpiR family transcriptional regulator [Rhodospirillales bacterium]|nr:MurR/RpiR family transcriptional regulator [Rhodospirillales bacterium]
MPKKPDTSRTPATDTASPGFTALEKAIRKHYPELPESERRIADLILEFPGEVAAYTATELAKLSNGSKAAVTRLIQRLGYSNYDEARRTARDAQAWGSPVYLMAKKPEPSSFAARVQSHIEQDTQNINVTLQSLRPDTVRAIVKAICKAKRVFCLGWRNSYFLAGYLQWQIIQVRPDVILLPAAGNTLAENVAAMNKDDILICVGMRRRVPQMNTVIAQANANGAKVLYVTDRTAPPVASATWTIPCAVRGTDPLDRYGAVLSLFHFLSIAVFEEMAEHGRDHLQTIERLHDELGELQ